MPKKIMGSTFTIHKILFLFSFLPNVNGQSAGTIPSSITGCGNAGATKTAIKTTELTAMGCISVSGCSAAAAVVSGGAGSSRCAASAYPSSSLPTTGSIGEDEPGSKSKFTQEIALPEEVALSIGDTGGCADSAKEIDRSNAVDLICNNLFLMFVKSSFMSSLLSIPIVLILLLRCFILLHLTTYLTKYCARLFTCSKAKVNLNLALTKMVSTKKSSNILNMGWSFKFVLVLCFMDVADAYEKLPNGNGKYIAADRSGDTLGRIIDDLLQDYRGSNGNIVSKPSAAQTTAEIVEKYGPVKDWDMSEVTNMHFAFWNKRTFVGDISKWDMSGVTTMQQSK